MHKRPLFLLLTTIAFATIFFMGYKLGDRKKFAADLSASLDATTTSTSTSTPTPAPTLADVLQELQGQEQLLTNQMTDLRSQLEVIDLKTVFTRTMKRGDSGDDVSKLQELLGKIPGIYPSEANASDMVTGYYGYLTEIAVTKFQEQAGLKPTGVVDQDTKRKLYESEANLAADENSAAEFVPIDLSTVADLQNSAYLQDQISQVASDTADIQASMADLQSQILQIASNVSDLQANVAAAPNPSPAPTPTPTPAPLLAISNVQAINITRTSSTIIWATNNPSTSEVDYSQNSSMPANQTSVASSAALTTIHSVALLHLNAATKYYYRVVSKDGAGAVATSANLSFSTLH